MWDVSQKPLITHDFIIRNDYKVIQLWVTVCVGEITTPVIYHSLWGIQYVKKKNKSCLSVMFISCFPLSLSVSVLIFNTTSHCFVLVKQFRPGRSPPHEPAHIHTHTHISTTVQYSLFNFLLVTRSRSRLLYILWALFTKKAAHYNPCLFNWISVTMHTHK